MRVKRFYVPCSLRSMEVCRLAVPAAGPEQPNDNKPVKIVCSDPAILNEALALDEFSPVAGVFFPLFGDFFPLLANSNRPTQLGLPSPDKIDKRTAKN